MFSDKERESWQNIKAPISLLEKTKNRLEEETPEKNTNYKKMMMTLVAASFVLIFSLVFFMLNDGESAHIYIGGEPLTEHGLSIAQEPMGRARALEASLVFTVESDDKADISVLQGLFDVIEVGVVKASALTSYTINGKTMINWTYPIPEDGECVSLTVKTGDLLQTVKVEHDLEAGLKNVTLIKNK